MRWENGWIIQKFYGKCHSIFSKSLVLNWQMPQVSAMAIHLGMNSDSETPWLKIIVSLSFGLFNPCSQGGAYEIYINITKEPYASE